MKNIVFEDLKDKHVGERVFIVANGPSLAETNLDLLENEITIAMNRVSLIYDKNPKWRPTYYLFSSTNVRNPVWGKAWTESVRRSVSEPSTTSFIASMFKPTIDPSNAYPQVQWFGCMSENKPDRSGNILESCFSTNVVNRIDKSASTINLALQLSYHMGFNEIVFVGADLGWTADRGSTNDPNHFDKSYRADIPPEKVYKANHQMRNVHSLAYKNFIKKNKDTKFYNASAKTLLDVYPIINYEEYITNNNIVYDEERLKEASKFWDKPHQFKID
jgi:hypothetical protein